MPDIEYSVITSDVMKRFDCTCLITHLHVFKASVNKF